MPAARGRKDPSLLAPVRQRTAPNVVYVVANRPLKVGEYTVPAGVEIPGAASWPRVEAWVGARAIRQLGSGEKYITFADFTAAEDAEKARVAATIAAIEAAMAEEAAEAALKAEAEAKAPVATE